ncbi:MAG: phosphoribosylformylglycinamidine cyclo-ligase, partial [Cyanobacteria bacterium J06641_5]
DLVASTRRPEVLGELGGFGGCFRMPTGYREPVLVSGTDGVGTKLKLAQALNAHQSVGIDLVAMCVNDILTLGAEPLFFLDYLATGKLAPAQLQEVVAGIAAGCQASGCALLGGETAEMPGFYQANEYDLAGFCVGIAERDRLLDSSRVQIGDAIIGIASSGVHSNGFSLVRRVLAADGRELPGLFEIYPEILRGESLGNALLQPTKIYVKPILSALAAGLEIHSMAHITGGGLPENLPRCLAPTQAAHLDPDTWEVPPIFSWLATSGNIAPADMYATFNMGIGYALVVPASKTKPWLAWLRERELAAWHIGQVIPGDGSILGLPAV